MRSGNIHVAKGSIKVKGIVPSLVDLCVQTAIDNVRYLGDVGETDQHLLGRILSHCTVEQLAHIEASTEGRDLSPITDKLWKNFFRLKFGDEFATTVMERMKRRKASFKWKTLYEAKAKERKDALQKSIDKVKERYEEEGARKQSRQVRLCTKVPPSSCKRSFYGGGPSSYISNTKSNIMKKAKLDFLKSREIKNLAAMKKNCVQRSPSVCSINRPGIGSGKGSASTFNQIRGRF